jgi:aspartokinase-like uncharacterized kinase
MKPVVIKLGGSLLADPHDGRLRRWCERLTGEAAGRAVIVPGGGPYADAVRDAQARWRFSDDVAHRMALRAMDQCGLMLCDLFPDFVAVDDADALAASCAAGRTPVWLPSRNLDLSADIPRDWTVTSDSIAVWLAARIGSPTALLVKSCALPDGDLAALAALGIVDPHLPHIAARTNVTIRLVDTLPALL